MSEQRREFYRVEFPESDRPCLFIDQVCYEVLDISEVGVRFQLKDVIPLFLDSRIDAHIRFSDGHVSDSSGDILYQRASSVIVMLDQRISLKRIRSEHLHLINKYTVIK